MTTTINASTSSGLVVTPDNSGNVLLQYNGQGAPAFSAYANSNQTFPAGASTKVLFTAEEFDTNNNFASSTFTPTVAGYYQISTAMVAVYPASESHINIYKNGINIRQLQNTQGAYTYSLGGSSLVYCNGTTDYIDIYCYSANGFTNITSAPYRTWFTGCLLRGA